MFSEEEKQIRQVAIQARARRDNIRKRLEAELAHAQEPYVEIPIVDYKTTSNKEFAELLNQEIHASFCRGDECIPTGRIGLRNTPINFSFETYAAMECLRNVAELLRKKVCGEVKVDIAYDHTDTRYHLVAALVSYQETEDNHD